MPYTIDWYIENEIIYVAYSGVTTAEELEESLYTIKEMIESSPRHLVHVISDVGDVTQSVKPLESLGIVRKVGNSPQSGWMIILREKSALIKFGVALGTTVFKSRNRTFDTLEQAVEFIKGMDTTLNWDAVNTVHDERTAS
ncbi:MAG: hypothetical protein RLP44_18245 [Aggregatilineales bacterium]